ncbi:MAG: hypothetical protein DMG96_36485 [Acidobacteria bacterium]|nr:MAG: hypothetical protein DMG96_36485 [Acidobacteriota bacterium]
MARFTQLNLQGKPESKAAPNIPSANQRPRFCGKKFSRKQKTAALVGLLMVTSLLAVFFLGTSGCSKKEPAKSVAMSQNQPMPPASITPNSPKAPTESLPAAPKKPAKKSAKRRSSTVTYTNRTYGLSFQYPRSYILKTGDEANLHWTASEPVQMDFVQPGGVAVAAVEPRRGSSSRGSDQATDFTSVFFNVSVNPNLTSAQCTQFAFPKPDDAPVGLVSPAKVTVGAIEFDEIEDAMPQADARYYHVFKNGGCYEFALGLETTVDEAKEGVTRVSSKEVFGKLEKILSTVKIQEPAVQAGAPAGTAQSKRGLRF